jgi:hypothetical protein
MVFDTDCDVARDPGREARQLWTRVVAEKG